METIFIAKSSRGSARIHAGPRATFAGLTLVVVAIAAAFYVGYRHHPEQPDPRPDLYAAALQAEIERQSVVVDGAIRDSEDNLDALALRLGETQARLVRLDALGARLVEAAGFDEAEFGFGSLPARGGAAPTGDAVTQEIPDFIAALEELKLALEDRSQKLAAIEETLMGRRLEAQVHPTGRPVRSGWTSSPYGSRIDPKTGKRAFHEGIDLAGRHGSEIIAVASGVVVWSGTRTGYGRVVEIYHGSGYSTRYAHNKKNLVRVGDTVRKGQVIAHMGASGNVTGTHLHFEVRKEGKSVNPIDFIRAASN